MFKDSKNVSRMISMLLVMALALFGCSKGEQDGQTADTNAVTSEHTEHMHAAVTESGSESDAWNRLCPGCPEKFEKNPQDYVKNLNEDGTEFIGG